MGARVHHGVDHTQHVHLASEHIPVEVELIGLHRCLQQHAVGAGHRACIGQLRQAFPGQALERLHQPADHPQLPGAETRMAVQVGMVAHLTRQHRKRGLDRLDEQRVGQALGDRSAVFCVQQLEVDIRLGGHPLQHLARIQLVLAGQHRRHRRAGPAHAFGQQGCRQRAELLVVGRDGAPAPCLRLARQPADKTRHVEPGQVGVAGEREQVETRLVQRQPLGRRHTRVAHAVPVVVEKQERAVTGGGHAGGVNQKRTSGRWASAGAGEGRQASVTPPMEQGGRAAQRILTYAPAPRAAGSYRSAATPLPPCGPRAVELSAGPRAPRHGCLHDRPFVATLAACCTLPFAHPLPHTTTICRRPS